MATLGDSTMTDAPAYLKIGVAWVAVLVLSATVPAAEADGFRTVNLSRWFNNDGISSQANLDDGNFSEGILYPAESLPASGDLMVADIPFFSNALTRPREGVFWARFLILHCSAHPA